MNSKIRNVLARAASWPAGTTILFAVLVICTGWFLHPFSSQDLENSWDWGRS